MTKTPFLFYNNCNMCAHSRQCSYFRIFFFKTTLVTLSLPLPPSLSVMHAHTHTRLYNVLASDAIMSWHILYNMYIFSTHRHTQSVSRSLFLHTPTFLCLRSSYTTRSTFIFTYLTLLLTTWWQHHTTEYKHSNTYTRTSPSETALGLHHF